MGKLQGTWTGSWRFEGYDHAARRDGDILEIVVPMGLAGQPPSGWTPPPVLFAVGPSVNAPFRLTFLGRRIVGAAEQWTYGNPEKMEEGNHSFTHPRVDCL